MPLRLRCHDAITFDADADAAAADTAAMMLPCHAAIDT